MPCHPKPPALSLLLLLGLPLAGPVLAQTMPVPSASPHPGYDNVDVLPAAWRNQERKAIGGIALLPDGRLVATIWRSGDLNNRNGEAHILSGTLTARSASEVTVAPLSTTLLDPLGAAFVDGRIYVLEKDRLARFDPDGAGWKYAIEYGGHNPFATRYFYHWFSMGLVHHGGRFHWTLGGFTQYREFVDPDPLRHGTWVEYDPAAKSHKFLVHGLRNTGGVSLGPDGTLCTTDNQGEWIPTNKFICMEPGKWYGWDGPEALARQDRAETPPTVWNTYNDLGNSPGQTLLLPKGRYAGQMIMTDVNRAWLTRLFLEKVKGHWQGANVFFSGGFNSGTFRLALAPDSSTLLVAGVGGNGGGWKYGNTYTSLHRLAPNAKPVFEILAVRSLDASRMEVEFTERAGAAAAAPASYTVTSWKNVAGPGYGSGHKSDTKTLTVAGAALSQDGRKAVLTVQGLAEGRIVRIKAGNALRSQAGDTLWSGFADYTLNAFGPAEPPTGIRIGAAGDGGRPLRHALLGGGRDLRLALPSPGAYRVAILTPQGRTAASLECAGPALIPLAGMLPARGLHLLVIRDGEGRSVTRPLPSL